MILYDDSPEYVRPAIEVVEIASTRVICEGSLDDDSIFPELPDFDIDPWTFPFL